MSVSYHICLLHMQRFFTCIYIFFQKYWISANALSGSIWAPRLPAVIQRPSRPAVHCFLWWHMYCSFSNTFLYFRFVWRCTHRAAVLSAFFKHFIGTPSHQLPLRGAGGRGRTETKADREGGGWQKERLSSFSRLMSWNADTLLAEVPGSCEGGSFSVMAG